MATRERLNEPLYVGLDQLQNTGLFAVRAIPITPTEFTGPYGWTKLEGEYVVSRQEDGHRHVVLTCTAQAEAMLFTGLLNQAHGRVAIICQSARVLLQRAIEGKSLPKPGV